jgi:hypothetical protein
MELITNVYFFYNCFPIMQQFFPLHPCLAFLGCYGVWLQPRLTYGWWSTLKGFKGLKDMKSNLEMTVILFKTQSKALLDDRHNI